VKALVTGGAGFIGSNVAGRLLREGWEVAVLDNLSTGYRKNLQGLDVEFVHADIRDEDAVSRAVRGVDAVFHLAACVGNVRSLQNPQEDSAINVVGTLNVLTAARNRGIGCLVYSSSAAIFGELQGAVVNEEHPQNPSSPYGVSKLAGEKHALCVAAMCQMVIVCLRYFNVFGVNQRYDAYGNVIPIFAHRLISSRPLTIYGDGKQTRDFVNVKDVAVVNFLAATRARRSAVYNIGCGQSITINQLAAEMETASGITAPVEYAPPRSGEVLHCCADITRARQDLGFQPDRDIRSGLREYLEWFRGDWGDGARGQGGP
jgi:UDP-glucose 4-epimerase